MDIQEVEIEVRKILSLMDKYGYKDTVEQLECLILLWKKINTKIHVTSSERSQFAESFNTIKAVTMRNEFLEIHKLPYCEDIFDCIDNLFSRLTSTKPDPIEEFTFLFHDITKKTEMFENMLATINKMNSLTGLATKSPDVPKFYIECFVFLLAMEGLYDEIVRFVYATEQIIDKKTISPDILKNMGIEEIKKNMRTPPRVILDIWNSGHRVRNAIAHARFYYDRNANKMRFVDVNPHDPTDVYTTFLEVKEVEDLVRKIKVISNAFYHLSRLLDIYSLLMVAPERLIFYR